MGFEVAVSGDRFIASTPTTIDDGRDEGTRAAVVYRHDGKGRAHESSMATDARHDGFGTAAALEGLIAVVSGPQKQWVAGGSPQNVAAGAVYLFTPPWPAAPPPRGRPPNVERGDGD